MLQPLTQDAPGNCVAKIANGEREGTEAFKFADVADGREYAVDLSELVGGRPAGDFTLLDDENALMRAWRPETVAEVDATNWIDILEKHAAELASTALSEITPSGGLVPALEGPGQVFGGGVLRVN